MKRSYLLAAPLLLVVFTMPSFAFARDNHRGRQTANVLNHVREQRPQQHWREEREARERRERREREERWRLAHHHEYTRNEHHPAGWDHGKKQGWQGRELPKGQAKKTGYAGPSGRH